MWTLVFVPCFSKKKNWLVMYCICLWFVPSRLFVLHFDVTPNGRTHAWVRKLPSDEPAYWKHNNDDVLIFWHLFVLADVDLTYTPISFEKMKALWNDETKVVHLANGNSCPCWFLKKNSSSWIVRPWFSKRKKKTRVYLNCSLQNSKPRCLILEKEIYIQCPKRE
jgi:hypothetical protein